MSAASEVRVRQRFEKETAEHAMTVLRDDGLYRHLRFRSPETWAYGFDIVTWPGYLYIGGDVEDYVFARTVDMFEFFAGDARDAGGTINPHYWSEKLKGSLLRSARGQEYTREAFRARVLEWASQKLEEWDEEAADADLEWEGEHFAVYPSLLIGALERELLREDTFHWLPGDEREAHELLTDYDWLFGETWEWDLREYDEWFLWACWAIVWGIEQYRAATPCEVAA